MRQTDLLMISFRSRVFPADIVCNSLYIVAVDVVITVGITAEVGNDHF